MERFGARKSTPLETCLAEVEQSDIYIGIISYRLGSIERSTGKSYTQLEYEKALDLKKDILIYMPDEKSYKTTIKLVDIGDNNEKLQSFKSILKERHTIDTFNDENDLHDKLKRKFDDILRKKRVERHIDEYDKSKSIIDRFLLVPKAYSGKEILLKVDIKSDPFPASKEVCSAFNLEYGKTIGTEISIIEPKVDEKYFKHLFVDYSQLETFWKIKETGKTEIYCQLQFSEDPINNQKANFVDETYSFIDDALYGTDFFMKTRTVKAEGSIILEFVDLK